MLAKRHDLVCLQSTGVQPSITKLIFFVCFKNQHTIFYFILFKKNYSLFFYVSAGGDGLVSACAVVILC